ncbi:MAG: ABC transporter permease [Terrisporobacter othiniensis]|uniref:ABC transporter permease n=1 Tax=Terrisporobacter othiniensis TaxID=1577792 RepID=UPI0009444B97|nr:ABC transporter permease [Terrisporobacter othiniensis]MDU6983441.1 ABC transporter permease [Terrisporobacter othiniensis]
MWGVTTAIWERYIEFKNEFWKNTISQTISPLLYMIAFGMGLGNTTQIDGHSYIQFIIPGIIALTTMNASFSSIAMSLNVQRLFEHSFEQIIMSPTPIWQYVLGQTIGGALRGVYSGVIVLIISAFFNADIHITPMFILVMLLNGMLFASLGVFAAINSKTHSSVSRFSTYVILPMTFLCNTFFSLDNVSGVVKFIIEVLPLTHSSRLLRDISFLNPTNYLSLLILILYMILFISISIYSIKKLKNL